MENNICQSKTYIHTYILKIIPEPRQHHTCEQHNYRHSSTPVCFQLKLELCSVLLGFVLFSGSDRRLEDGRLVDSCGSAVQS